MILHIAKRRPQIESTRRDDMLPQLKSAIFIRVHCLYIYLEFQNKIRTGMAHGLMR